MGRDRDCSRCGVERADVRVRLPASWVTYLTDERGQDLSLRATMVAVCHPCQYDLEKVIEESRERADESGYPEELWDAVTTELDGLDVE